MSSFIIDLMTNQVLWASLLAWFLAQTVKAAILTIKEKVSGLIFTLCLVVFPLRIALQFQPWLALLALFTVLIRVFLLLLWFLLFSLFMMQE